MTQNSSSNARPIPPIAPVSATSIDEVIAQLTAIIDWSLANDSRLGYFPALYRRVTLTVRERVAHSTFQDGERLTRLTVIFANRYIDAFAARAAGKPVTRVWGVAFDACDDYWPIVLQHLLLGMNAHINLDLGLAAAETMRGGNIDELRDDFNVINGILASLVDEVQHGLAGVWMTLRVLNRFVGSIDDAIINFSLQRARDEAWLNAQRFSKLSESQLPEAIVLQDKRAAVIARLVRYPGIFLGIVTKIVRVGEVQSTRRVIELLTSDPVR